MTAHEWTADALADRDLEAAWRESRDEWERQRAEDLALDVSRESTRTMIDRWAADRAKVEAESAVEFEAHRGLWRRSYPLQGDAA